MAKAIEGLLIGFGNMGQTHLERYKTLGVPISIVETDEEKAKIARACRLTVYPSISGVPQINQIGFFDICTPTYLHFQHLQEAIQHKKPILVEKPVVRTREEVKMLRGLSNDYPVPIFVAEVEQYNPQLQGFLSYTDAPVSIRIKRAVNLESFLQGAKPWFLDENLSGGIVLDLMIHDINLLIAKYGKPAGVELVSWSQTKYDCPDDVKAKLFFADFDADIHSCWISEDQIHPIKTLIEMAEQDGNVLKFACDNYHIKSKANREDAFYKEIQSFLEAVKSGKLPYPLSVYLDGVDVALDIITQMKSKR